MRNNPCRCLSGKKYKNCHLYIDQGYVETSNGWVHQSVIIEARRKIEDEKQRNRISGGQSKD